MSHFESPRNPSLQPPGRSPPSLLVQEWVMCLLCTGHCRKRTTSLSLTLTHPIISDGVDASGSTTTAAIHGPQEAASDFGGWSRSQSLSALPIITWHGHWNMDSLPHTTDHIIKAASSVRLSLQLSSVVLIHCPLHHPNTPHT